LLVIDVQNFLVEDPRLHDPGPTLEAIAGLQERARRAGVPVLHARHTEQEAWSPQPGSREWQIHEDVAPADGEPVVDKLADDAFWGTDLGERLAALGIDRLVVAGMLSEHCVGTTARSAVAHGYDVVVAADGHTTLSNDLLEAGRAIEYQNMLLDGFGTPQHEIAVLPSRDIELR
ncbi:MAG TPA: cysteine hydrolase family protein, partial [Gaiellales bacterium]|nr:cysteine hydrolase family protein [Gaiellales bacterium]